KLDDANGTLYVSDAINELYALDKNLKLTETWNTPSAVVDLLFQKNKEPRALCIGSIAPSEKKEGLLLSLDSTEQKASFGGLARPVNIEKADVNQDGKEDIVICQFGNHTGKISWLDGGDIRKENILVYRPGARKAEIVDLNKDGKLDIVVMMAQAYEGIYYLENKGGGIFKETPLVKFPPVYGVSYFEMIDINKDGFLDIVMSNGDNWDLSRVKKRFHGVRILLNDKLNHFKESFFFPMYGASKAVARDFDGDGDLDIAAISFYDDLAKPEQGFIYFENTGNMQFAPTSTPEAANGKWLTMEVADIDKDGDTDIVLGSFIYTFSEMTQLLMKGIEHFPQLLVLRNNKK
ncbi:MAG: VCBS repeat-containing protein, partial [Bacteroidetes bacterium]|nr:VCBS repeat-containing protein [Bacteroidota bacterium]